MVIFEDPEDYEKEDMMTIDEFKSHVEACGILDSDGFGYFGTETQISDIEVDCDPSQFCNIPEWATHVYWFNK